MVRRCTISGWNDPTNCFRSSTSSSATPSAYCPGCTGFIDLDGAVQLCCVADRVEGHLRDDQGKKLYMQQGLSEEQLANLAQVREIRRDMLAGRWPSVCKPCLVTESTGRESRRIIENRRFKDHIPWIVDNTDSDGRAPLRITSRDYRPGNLCNLKCRMCSPDASVQLIEEFDLIHRRKLTAKEIENYRTIDWYKKPHVWDSFRQHVHDLEHLHFAGGEPMFTPEVITALEICIEEGSAANIELTFNTNMTMLPERMTKLWPHFRGVTLMCSIDGYGPVNDYIRYPARWSVIERNLQKIDREHKELNVIRAQLNVTVQVYNILHLGELVEYCHREFKFITPMPSMVYLTEPRYYNIQILPEAMKQQVRDQWQSLEKRLRKQGVTAGFEELQGPPGVHGSGLGGDSLDL